MTKKAEILGKFHQLTEKSMEKPFHQRQNSASPLVEQLHSLRLSHAARRSLVLLQQEGKQNQRTLAKSLDISPQAVSELVKKLLHHGCIIKEQGSQKNENLLSLSELGENYALHLKIAIEIHSEDFFKSFTEEDLQQFESLLDKLLQ